MSGAFTGEFRGLFKRWEDATLFDLETAVREYYAQYPDMAEWIPVFDRFFDCYVNLIIACNPIPYFAGKEVNHCPCRGPIDQPFYMDRTLWPALRISGIEHDPWINFPQFKPKKLGPRQYGWSESAFFGPKTYPGYIVSYKTKHFSWHCFRICGYDFLLFTTNKPISKKKVIERADRILREMYCFETLQS